MSCISCLFNFFSVILLFLILSNWLVCSLVWVWGFLFLLLFFCFCLISFPFRSISLSWKFISLSSLWKHNEPSSTLFHIFACYHGENGLSPKSVFYHHSWYAISFCSRMYLCTLLLLGYDMKLLSL